MWQGIATNSYLFWTTFNFRSNMFLKPIGGLHTKSEIRSSHMYSSRNKNFEQPIKSYSIIPHNKVKELIPRMKGSRCDGPQTLVSASDSGDWGSYHSRKQQLLHPPWASTPSCNIDSRHNVSSRSSNELFVGAIVEDSVDSKSNFNDKFIQVATPAMNLNIFAATAIS